MVVNGVLRTLWVNIPHRVRFMDVRFKTAPKEMLAFRRVRKRAVLKTISSRVRQHAELTDIDGSLAEINVESPACGARTKTTIVRKPQWSKSFFIVTICGGSAIKMKVFGLSFCIALALHYFCTMKREGTVDRVCFPPIID